MKIAERLCVGALLFVSVAFFDIIAGFAMTTDYRVENDIVEQTVVQVQSYTGISMREYVDGKRKEKAVLQATTEKEHDIVQEPRYNLTDGEKRLMSVTIWNADHTDETSLLMCGMVILNRAYNDSRFPDSVEGVLRAKGQFETCDKVMCDRDLYDFDYVVKIIDKLCDGYDPFDGDVALYYARKTVSPNRIAKNLYLVASYGDHNYWGQK